MPWFSVFRAFHCQARPMWKPRPSMFSTQTIGEGEGETEILREFLFVLPNRVEGDRIN